MRRPSTWPVTTHSRACRGAGTTSAAAHTKRAARRSSGTSATWASTRSRLAWSSPCRPAQRAGSTPGMPFSASTHRPESSATAGRRVKAAMARAFSSAFSSNVAPVSGTSGAPGNSSSPVTLMVVPRIRDSSRSLASFLVARTTASAGMAVQGGALQAGQLAAAGHSEVEELAEHVAAERLALRGALDLHEGAAGGADHVHVGVGHHVLVVTQVEAGLAVDDPHTARGHRGEQRLALGPLPALQPGHGVGQRDITAGHRRGAGPAVGLQHVTVDGDGVLAERLVVHAGPQRTADEPGYLVGPPA